MTKKARKPVLEAIIKPLLSAKNHHVRMVRNIFRYAAIGTALCVVLCVFHFFCIGCGCNCNELHRLPSSLSIVKNYAVTALSIIGVVIIFGAIPLLLARKADRFIKISSNKRIWFFRIFVFLIFLSIESFAVPYIAHFVLGERFVSPGSSGAPYAQLKPVIYLYPTKEQEVHVELDYHGKLTTTYPAYSPVQKGWRVIAYPDGHLIDMADDETYSYLFWEGTPDAMKVYDLSTGFVHLWQGTSAAFLRTALKRSSA